MYEFETRIKYSEVDANQRLTTLGLIDYFQSCSTFQSEDMSVGIDYLNERHLAWIVVSYDVRIERLPKLGEYVHVQTWPYDMKGMFGYRNFAMADAEGNRIAYANSLWVLMDMEAGKPTKVPDELAAAYLAVSDPAIEMGRLSRKILLPDSMQNEEPIPVQRYFIDTNHHMNNGKYIMVAQSYLPDDFDTAQMRVEYRTEARLGDILYPQVGISDGTCTVALCDDGGKPHAIVAFTKR